MTRRISRFAIHRTSATIALLYGLYGLFFVPMLLLSPPADHKPGNFVFALPVLFTVLSYAMVAVMCAVYNLVARWTGGIELTIDEERDPHGQNRP